MKARFIAAGFMLVLAACGGSASSQPAIDLVGSSWRLQEVGGAEVVDLSQGSMTFGTDGRASGSTGCNRWSAAVTRDGGKLSFGEAISTRMACSPALMEQEQHFLEALQRTRGVTTDGPFLRLRDAAGKELARLVRE